MENLLTPTEVADHLGVTVGTLSVWRCNGRYDLPYVKIGRRVMYRLEDVSSFIESRMYHHSGLAMEEL